MQYTQTKAVIALTTNQYKAMAGTRRMKARKKNKKLNLTAKSVVHVIQKYTSLSLRYCNNSFVNVFAAKVSTRYKEGEKNTRRVMAALRQTTAKSKNKSSRKSLF